MKQIPVDKRERLRPLFAGHLRMRVLVEAMIEGHGDAMADDEDEPRLARLSLSVGFQAIGGDPGHPQARAVLKGLPTSLVLPGPDAWRDLLLEVHGERVQRQPRTALSAASLDLGHLRSLAQLAPRGFEVKQIDAGLAGRMADEMETKTILSLYETPEAFVKRSAGFAALDGGRIVAAATGVVACRRGLEVQIETHPDYRGRGLAAATGAALVAHCLERGLEPEWDAENEMSVRLAQKLGYAQPEPYEALIVINQ